MIRQMLIISSMFIGLVLMAHACLKNRIPRTYLFDTLGTIADCVPPEFCR